MAVLKERIPNEIHKAAESLYPIAEPTQQIGGVLKISGTSVENEPHLTTDYNYFSKNRKEKLTINAKYLVMEIFEYSEFEPFRSNFIKVLQSISNFNKDIQFERLGLRYVDQITIDEGNPFDWSKYINKKLLNQFEVASDKDSICRALSLIEQEREDYSVRFQYGMALVQN